MYHKSLTSCYRREPKCLVKPQKSDESNDDYNERLKKAKSTASRNLILIRHGQYEMGPSDDKNRVLTLLGKYCILNNGSHQRINKSEVMI